MLIHYRQIQHRIEFEKPVIFPTLPTFLFRSILGKELRRLVCIFRDRPCGECGLKFTCAYSWMFETPIEKETPVLEGRDRASHPFLLATDAVPQQSYQGITLTLTILGKAIEYYPYLYYALRRAGEIGVLRDRIPYRIMDVRCEDRSILQGNDSLHPTYGIREWCFLPQTKENRNCAGKTESVQLFLDTPLRLRIEGKYSDSFTAPQFLEALWRRAQILCSFYGQENGKESPILNLTDPEIRILSRSFQWKDYPYFSSRQKKLLRLGGIVGEFTMQGALSPAESALLYFGELFHVGKNTAFGLGRYHVSKG